MAVKSSIQWTDATWNIARGCTKVDEDCKFCYMYRDSFNSTRYNPIEVVKTKSVFNLPLKLKEPSKIFTCSLTDFFHEGCDSFRNEAWDIIRKCPQHIFQILTKRPERIADHTPADLLEANNIWFGTSVGSQKAVHRINELEKIKAKTKFISFEPLHDEIKTGYVANVDWIIIGGESGNDTGKYRYRPCKAEWMDTIINGYKEADACGLVYKTPAIFVKQMGTHLAKEMKMSDRHGGNIDEFPINLQIREFPNSLKTTL